MKALLQIAALSALIFLPMSAASAEKKQDGHYYSCVDPDGCPAFVVWPDGSMSWERFRQWDMVYSGEPIFLPRDQGWRCRSCSPGHEPK